VTQPGNRSDSAITTSIRLIARLLADTFRSWPHQ
jgi:hypothetical protein